MTNEEAIEIKGEILNKAGEIRIGSVKVCDNMVDITDVLDIINSHIDKEKVRNKMTYGDIYDEFCKKFPNVEVEDYRPANKTYIPELSRGIPNAIIVWLKDGSEVIYIAESDDKEGEQE